MNAGKRAVSALQAGCYGEGPGKLIGREDRGACLGPISSRSAFRRFPCRPRRRGQKV